MTFEKWAAMPTNRMRQWLRCAVLSSSVLAGRLAATASPAATTPDQPAFHATSTIRGLKFITLNTLPKAPTIVGRQICDCVADPTSEGGKLVKAQGWPVTGEAPMGRFEAVSFAARFEEMYGGQ